jgi:hypothetical protein
MQSSEIHIGIDFDNTIVSYDSLFHTLATEQGLIPRQLAPNKTAVRDYLRSVGKEERWTALQGIAYGERMDGAAAFPGAFDFIRACLRDGARVSIISHRTQKPIVGKPVDLHAAARAWLDRNSVTALVGSQNIHFELTRKEKVARLQAAACHYFIDDLPEFLGEPSFPSKVGRILFDPAGVHAPDKRWHVVREWFAFGPRPSHFLAELEY